MEFLSAKSLSECSTTDLAMFKVNTHTNTQCYTRFVDVKEKNALLVSTSILINVWSFGI